jgi:hypothetical protein
MPRTGLDVCNPNGGADSLGSCDSNGPVRICTWPFPALKVAVDAHRTRDQQFLLTGSQKSILMKSVSESLAGGGRARGVGDALV